MPNWNGVLSEIQRLESSGNQSAGDAVRHKYLHELHRKTGRNTIIYYSGWLYSPEMISIHSITDADKTGFMTAIHGMDRSLGLDLFLHTPGGDIAAAESLVNYLRGMFGTNVRAIVPELAMSAGTMIACACSEIVMGKQSSLGPIDPQFNGLSAPAIVEEFERAVAEVTADPARRDMWALIISKYHPTLLGACERAVEWSKDCVQRWLETGMLSDSESSSEAAKAIVQSLGDHKNHKSHSRHIPIEECLRMGLRVVPLEGDQELQDLVLSVHHAAVITLSRGVAKLIENHDGVSFVATTGAPAAA